MNKFTLFSILLVLLAACDKMDITPTQADSFIKYYNTFPVFRGADVKVVPGKGFAAIGTVKSYTSGTEICLIRTDVYGNSLDSARYYGRPLDDEAYCLQVLEDNGFAILGSSVSSQSGKKEVYLIRTDSIGNVIWTKTIPGTGNVEAYHFEVNPAGSFIMTGYTEVVKQGVVDKDIWLFGLDKNGDHIETWSGPRVIGGVKDDIGTCLQLLSNGNIVITGQTRSYPSTTNSHAFVIVTNPNGNVNSLSWIKSDRDEEGNYIRVLSDNSFIVIGTCDNSASGYGTDIILKKVTITLPSPQINWERTYEYNGNDYGNTLILNDNSLQLLVTTASAVANTSISLITTDMSGAILNSTSFGKGSELSGNAFVKTPDNGFIITGTNKHSENDISMVLIKVNADGSL